MVQQDGLLDIARLNFRLGHPILSFRFDPRFERLLWHGQVLDLMNDGCRLLPAEQLVVGVLERPWFLLLELVLMGLVLLLLESLVPLLDKASDRAIRFEEAALVAWMQLLVVFRPIIHLIPVLVILFIVVVFHEIFIATILVIVIVIAVLITIESVFLPLIAIVIILIILQR